MTVPTVGAASDPFAEFRIDPTQSQTRELKQEMDKDLFLDLLVASVRYQDPSEPMSTQEMVEQTTALSQMEQLLAMTEITKQQYELSQRTAAASMIGTEVSYVSGGVSQKGIVYGVRMSGEEMMVDLGGMEVNMKDITAVGVPRGYEADAPASGEQQNAESKTDAVTKTDTVTSTDTETDAATSTDTATEGDSVAEGESAAAESEEPLTTTNP